MKRIHQIASYGFVLGLIHTGLTPLFYDHLSEDTLWFAMTGVSLIYLGLLNLAAGRVWQAWFFDICIAANLIMLVFNIITLTVLPATAIQAYLALLITLAVTAGSIGCRLQIKPSFEPALSNEQ
jgi:sulfite exporter TauE/SafE